MIESGTELNEDIATEEEINEGVDNEEVCTSHDLWIKTELEWNTERIVKGQNNDEQFPMCLSRIVLTDHENVILVTNLGKESFGASDEVENAFLF